MARLKVREGGRFPGKWNYVANAIKSLGHLRRGSVPGLWLTKGRDRGEVRREKERQKIQVGFCKS